MNHKKSISLVMSFAALTSMSVYGMSKTLEKPTPTALRFATEKRMYVLPMTPAPLPAAQSSSSTITSTSGLETKARIDEKTSAEQKISAAAKVRAHIRISDKELADTRQNLKNKMKMPAIIAGIGAACAIIAPFALKIVLKKTAYRKFSPAGALPGAVLVAYGLYRLVPVIKEAAKYTTSQAIDITQPVFATSETPAECVVNHEKAAAPINPFLRFALESYQQKNLKALYQLCIRFDSLTIAQNSYLNGLYVNARTSEGASALQKIQTTLREAFDILLVEKGQLTKELEKKREEEAPPSKDKPSISGSSSSSSASSSSSLSSNAVTPPSKELLAIIDRLDFTDNLLTRVQDLGKYFANLR